MRNYNMPNYTMQPGNMPGRMDYTRCGMPAQRETSSCGRKDSCLERDYEVAMAYVPWQSFGELYEPEKSLDAGTIFVEMDKPFLGRGGMMRR